MIDTARAERKEDGIEQTKIKIAQSLREQGFSNKVIAQSTGLSISQIENLQNRK